MKGPSAVLSSPALDAPSRRAAVVVAVLVALLVPATTASAAHTPPATPTTSTAAEALTPGELTPGELRERAGPDEQPDAPSDEDAPAGEAGQTPVDPGAPRTTDDSSPVASQGRAAHPAFVTQPQTQHLFTGDPLRISFSYNGTAILSELVRLQRWVSGSGSAAVWENVDTLQVQRGVHVHTFDRGTATQDDSGRYRLESVQGGLAAGTHIGFSSEFQITVNNAPRVLSSPSNVSRTVGETATFSVSYDAGTLPTTVQWQRAPRGGGWTNVPGGTATTLTVPSTTLAMDGDSYQAVVTSRSTAGTVRTATSSPATLTVRPASAPPEFLVDPQDVTVTQWQTAPFRARVSIPAGLGANDVLVSWQTRPPGSSTWYTNTPWTAVTADGWADYKIYNTYLGQDGTSVRARVRLASGLDPSWESGEAVLTVRRPAPSITSHPTCDAVDEGTASTCRFSVADPSQVSEVRWQSQTGTGDWQTVATGTSTTYTTPPTTMAMHGSRYQVVVTGPGGTVTSDPAPLTMRMLPPVVTVHPEDVEVDEGQPATFTAAYAGTTSAVTTQWYATAPGGLTPLAVPGATRGTLDVSLTTPDLDGTRYHARFTNDVTSPDAPVETRAATLTVRAGPRVTEHPDHVTVLVGQPATFTASASGSQDGWSQQWFSSRDGLSWLPIPGATQSTYTIPVTTSAMDQTHYRARFTNATQKEADTLAATLTVITPPQASLRVAPRTRVVDALP